MAPEQFRSGTIGPHTDMFAWSATMPCAATGVHVFNPGGLRAPAAIIHRVLNHHPGTSPLPRPLRDLVAAALSKDPAERPTALDAPVTLLGNRPRWGTAPENPRPDSARPQSASPAADPAPFGAPSPATPARSGRWRSGRSTGTPSSGPGVTTGPYGMGPDHRAAGVHTAPQTVFLPGRSCRWRPGRSATLPPPCPATPTRPCGSGS